MLQQIKEDTTFYKAFRNLRVIGFTSYNDIKMLDKEGNAKASLLSKTRQNRLGNCRTMDVLEETITLVYLRVKRYKSVKTILLYEGIESKRPKM